MTSGIDRNRFPQATDSERFVLACVLTHPSSHARVFSQLTHGEFFDATYRAIFAAMVELHHAGSEIHADRVAASLNVPAGANGAEDAAEVLLELTDVQPNITALEAHLSALNNAMVGRRLCYRAMTAAKDVLGGKSSNSVVGTLMRELQMLQYAGRNSGHLPSADSIQSKPLKWLWPGWLPTGAVTIVDGDPGCGKTHIACDLAARITRGRQMPLLDIPKKPAIDSEQPPTKQPAQSTESPTAPEPQLPISAPANVLVLTGEDAHDTTTRPRLEAAGADLKRCFLWTSDQEPLQLPNNIDRLAAAVAIHNIRLLVIDPITAYLDKSINSNRDANVRRALQPLVALAQQTGTAVLLTRHLNKDTSKSALYRGGGSISFIAAARAAWVVGRDPRVADQFVLAMNKCNIARHPRAINYRIETAGPTSHIQWQAECDHRPSDILLPRHIGEKLAQAEQIVREELAHGPQPEADVRRACREAGLGDASYRAARSNLRVKCTKSAFSGGWQLNLPPEAAVPEGVATSNPQ
jgi:replicative DNA helicase